MPRILPSPNAFCFAILLACNGGPGPEDATDVCGDGLVGPTEACDDGNPWFADGCTPDCVVEEGPLEMEPNDAWNTAMPFAGEFSGNLPEGDVDCVSLEVERCEAVEATLTGECPTGVRLSLHDASGAQVAAGPEQADGCSRIDPADAPGARWLLGPTASVCVSSILGTPIVGYTLDVTTTSSEAFVDGEDDLDIDGVPDRCDDDRDGDGVLDIDDNCPTVPNGPDDVLLSPNAEGFVQQWLALGPVTETATPGGCLPAFDEREGGDANLAPQIGDEDGTLTWVPYLLDGNRLNLRQRFGFVPAPREAYVHTYVVVDEAQTLTLAVGADDGVRAWLDGTVVLEVDGCQGTNIDQFQAPVTLAPGINRLTLKVFDQGGGWGLYARFLDALGEPFTDFELSLSPDGSPLASQSDADGDGL
ncbi:MAG: hypothetical protein AAF602_01250, partial [Myxococcota bacterium]